MDAAEAGTGTLLVVGTPIGNLSDASPRSLDALRSADVVLAEDTRVTGRLLARFGIEAPLERADENVLARRVPEVLGRLRSGERVAFASDAGMPCVSDPGQRLVDAVLDAGLPAEVLPGPSAVTCAVAAAGLRCDRFLFCGFLERRPAALDSQLRELLRVPAALVASESPHRAARTLAAVAALVPGRRVALCRELTKVHEEVVRGTAEEVAREVASRERVQGECVVVVEQPAPGELAELARAGEEEPLEDAVARGLAAGEAPSRLARRLARERGLSRRDVYDLVVRAAGDEGEGGPGRP